MPILAIFGPKILIIPKGSKSSGTHISKTTNAPRLHCFIGRALHQMDQKGQCLAQNDQKFIFWANWILDRGQQKLLGSTLTSDLVLAGIMEKQPFLRFAEKRKMGRKSVFFQKNFRNLLKD